MAHTTEATGARGTRDPRGARRRASRSTVEGRRASHAWTPQTQEGAWRERMAQVRRLRVCATALSA
jgi:hypothetical protein